MPGFVCKKCKQWISFVSFANAKSEMCNDCIAEAKDDQSRA